MFNSIQQYKNRLKLANHLETNVEDHEYNHSIMNEAHESCCAIGHATRAGFADYRDDNIEKVYGENSWNTIFGAHHDFDRQSVIQLLRKWNRPSFIWRFIHA